MQAALDAWSGGGGQYAHNLIGSLDARGDNVLRSMHDRRHVVGGYSSKEWGRLFAERKTQLYEEALDRREAEGKPRYPTEEEKRSWWSGGLPSAPRAEPTDDDALEVLAPAQRKKYREIDDYYNLPPGTIEANADDAMPTGDPGWTHERK